MVTSEEEKRKEEIERKKLLISQIKTKINQSETVDPRVKVLTLNKILNNPRISNIDPELLAIAKLQQQYHGLKATNELILLENSEIERTLTLERNLNVQLSQLDQLIQEKIDNETVKEYGRKQLLESLQSKTEAQKLREAKLMEKLHDLLSAEEIGIIQKLLNAMMTDSGYLDISIYDEKSGQINTLIRGLIKSGIVVQKPGESKLVKLQDYGMGFK